MAVPPTLACGSLAFRRNKALSVWSSLISKPPRIPPRRLRNRRSTGEGVLEDFSMEKNRSSSLFSSIMHRFVRVDDKRKADESHDPPSYTLVILLGDFALGKFYELYDQDAEIGHKELDWKMTLSGVGKCRQVPPKEIIYESRETASALQHATQDSLVIPDELGRGTGAFNGYAIAYAVRPHLIEKVNCRLLFATHYHPLTKEFASHPHVMLQHMACTFKGQELVELLMQLQENHQRELQIERTTIGVTTLHEEWLKTLITVSEFQVCGGLYFVQKKLAG
ncbi:DNA mismatch repair protein MSH7 [Cucurbita argyrosperma subsp. argyrosperma]|nr:DNA mismatch repair protein MSH7 [Cucurbita argyrosperma subsp. argyrosperma]